MQVLTTYPPYKAAIPKAATMRIRAGVFVLYTSWFLDDILSKLLANSIDFVKALYASPIFTVICGILRKSTTFLESSISFCSPLGIRTPITLSAPNALAQRAAAIVESFPPLIQTIA